jgi:hypothetical protein
MCTCHSDNREYHESSDSQYNESDNRRVHHETILLVFSTCAQCCTPAALLSWDLSPYFEYHRLKASSEGLVLSFVQYSPLIRRVAKVKTFYKPPCLGILRTGFRFAQCATALCLDPMVESR